MLKPLIAAALTLSLDAAPARAVMSCADYNDFSRNAVAIAEQDAVVAYAESVYDQLNAARMAAGKQPVSTSSLIGGRLTESLKFWSQICASMGPDYAFRDAVVALYNMNSAFARGP